MSFKPIDLQVNISQINHVARNQQHQRLQPLLDQVAHAAHLRKKGDEKQHIVESKGQASNEDSNVKWRKGRDGGGGGEYPEKNEQRESGADSGDQRIIVRESDFPEKGGQIDTMR